MHSILDVLGQCHLDGQHTGLAFEEGSRSPGAGAS